MDFGAQELVGLPWCYGDLSVAISLLRAAKAVRSLEFETCALELIEHSAARTLSSTGVADGGLCHGSLGLAHLFQRCYLWTGSAGAREAAIKWLCYFADEQSNDPLTNYEGIGFLEGLTGGA